MKDNFLYYDIAIDVPIFKLFTYKSEFNLESGTRVLVIFCNKKKIGIIWKKNIIPKINKNNILTIAKIYEKKIILNNNWLKFIEFTSLYYHYPLGKSAFCALPKKFKQDIEIESKLQNNVYFKIKKFHDIKFISKNKNSWEFKLWQLLQESSLSLNQIKKIYPKATKILDKWINLNLVETINQSNNELIKKTKILLTDEQQNIKETILNHLNIFKTFLIYGITGSGKTEVYFEIIFKIIQTNKQVLFLIPEINLTTQLINRINNYFIGVETAILNSQISDLTRMNNFLNAKNGTCKLIIGTRLAVFTPMKKLGLIVVDEEQDTSFKQDTKLRYNARDLAVYLAKQNNCPIILGSATPSLESWNNVLKGNYQLLKLSRRAKQYSKLPQINIVNIKHKKLNNGFDDYTLQKLEQNLIKKGLSFIYINRRGYAPVIMCNNCEYIFSCPNCSSNLVYHSFDKKLKCHYCDYKQHLPNICPHCQNKKLIPVGTGTQKVEEFITNYFPKAKIFRIDKDKTNNKNYWTNVYNKINNNEADILIGTQILAKGHDFLNLNLIVILNADNSLYSIDFRASEKLFTEIVQVSGRAGRDKIQGEVLIQTKLPKNNFFHNLVTQDYETFIKIELQNRKNFSFPPFKYIIALKARSDIENNALNFLTQCKQNISPLAKVNILGPTSQIISKINKQERFQLFFESSCRDQLHFQIHKLHSTFEKIAKKYKSLNWFFDVDPYEY